MRTLPRRQEQVGGARDIRYLFLLPLLLRSVGAIQSTFLGFGLWGFGILVIAN